MISNKEYPFRECNSCIHTEVCKHIEAMKFVIGMSLPVDLSKCECKEFLFKSCICDGVSDGQCEGCDHEHKEMLTGTSVATGTVSPLQLPKCECQGNCQGHTAIAVGKTLEQPGMEFTMLKAREGTGMCAGDTFQVHSGGSIGMCEKCTTNEPQAKQAVAPHVEGKEDKDLIAEKMRDLMSGDLGELELDEEIGNHVSHLLKTMTPRELSNNLIGALEEVFGKAEAPEKIVSQDNVYNTLMKSCQQFAHEGYDAYEVAMSAVTVGTLCREAGVPNPVGMAVDSISLPSGNVSLLYDNSVPDNSFVISARKSKKK